MIRAATNGEAGHFRSTSQDDLRIQTHDQDEPTEVNSELG